jgi:histidinol-phosphatase
VDEPDLTVELSFAHELADVAAKVTLDRFGERLPVAWKPDATAVTEADVEVERVIRDAVSSAFPADGVHGEESGRTDGASGRTWVVDPIDGTVQYADGVPLWTTLIGLRVNGRAVLGVADAPALGVRYHAARGSGAWRGDRSLQVSGVSRLAEAFVLHSGIEEWIDGDDLDPFLSVCRTARRTRGLSDAWGHLLIAQGSAEALLEHEPCYEWDWTATSVIVEEAGGRLSTLDGGDPVVGRGLLVSNGAVHDETLTTLLLSSSSVAGSPGDGRGP